MGPIKELRNHYSCLLFLQPGIMESYCLTRTNMGHSHRASWNRAADHRPMTQAITSISQTGVYAPQKSEAKMRSQFAQLNMVTQETDIFILNCMVSQNCVWFMSTQMVYSKRKKSVKRWYAGDMKRNLRKHIQGPQGQTTQTVFKMSVPRQPFSYWVLLSNNVHIEVLGRKRLSAPIPRSFYLECSCRTERNKTAWPI